MTRNRLSQEGVPGDLNATYYAQRAGAGFIATEGTYVDSGSRAYVRQPGISNPEQAAGWTKVTQAVHDAGGRIFLQLLHAGRITHADLLNGKEPVAPSAIAATGEVHLPGERKAAYPIPRELTVAELPQVICSYTEAAERAFAAGFDGVELHGANGYLPHAFLSNWTNRRTDQYGGSVENRCALSWRCCRPWPA